MTIARDEINGAVKESVHAAEPGAAEMTNEQPRPRPTKGEPSGAPSMQPGMKPTKAEKLEAKAARLRDAEVERARLAAERAVSGDSHSSGVVPWQIATGVLAFVLALTLALGVPYGISRHDSVTRTSEIKSAQAKALSAAKKAAVDAASYNYQHLDTDFATILGDLTATFRKNYAPVTAKLKPLIEQSKAVATGTLITSGVVSATTKKVVVLAFLDQSVQTASSTTATINRNRIVITMVLQKGKWLVDNLVLQ